MATESEIKTDNFITEAEALEDKPVTNARNLIRSTRRQPNPDKWKQNVRKKLRQSGKEYINGSGKKMAKRQMHPGCGATCYLKCSDRFSEEQRQLIHNAFWRLKDEQKNIFYWKYTARLEPKRRRKLDCDAPRRGYTFKYRFEVRGEMIPVCSKFFFTTLDIAARRIYYFYEHCYDEETCMPLELKRGKNPKPMLPNIAERLDAVRQHISSFPKERLSSSTQKRYLAADLNITRMYKMYAESVSEPLKQHWYAKVFNEEYNLEFQQPKLTKTCENRNNVHKGTQTDKDRLRDDCFILQSVEILRLPNNNENPSMPLCQPNADQHLETIETDEPEPVVFTQQEQYNNYTML